MGHRLRGKAGTPFVGFLAWAGRLWEGWAVGAAGGSLGAADGSGRLGEAPL